MLKFHSQEIFTVFPWFFLGIRQGCKISSSVPQRYCLAFCVILLLIFQSRRRLGFFFIFLNNYLFTKL